MFEVVDSRLPEDCGLVGASISEFDSETVEDLAKALRTAERRRQEFFPIMIASDGGDVYSLFGMVDLLNQVKATMKVVTVAVGHAFSSGAALLTCGTPGFRFMSPNSVLVIHDVSSHGLGDDVKAHQLRIDLTETNRLSGKFFNLMESNSKCRKGVLKKRVAQLSGDWYVQPKEALKLGLIDHIGLPTFQTELAIRLVMPSSVEGTS